MKIDNKEVPRACRIAFEQNFKSPFHREQLPSWEDWKAAWCAAIEFSRKMRGSDFK